MVPGERAVAVAGTGRQGAVAADAEWTQVHFNADRLLLQVGGGRPHAVLPPVRRGEEHRRHHHTLRVSAENPLQAAS